MIVNTITPQLPMQIKAADIGWHIVLAISYHTAEESDPELATDFVLFHTTWGSIFIEDILESKFLINVPLNNLEWLGQEDLI